MLAPVSERSQVAGGGWLAAGASAVGTSHVADDKPCQDSHALRLLHGGTILAAVSDGAGSAEKSHIGARIAVETVMSAIAGELQASTPPDDVEWTRLLQTAFAAAARALEVEAASQGLPVRQFAATLLVTVLHAGRAAVASVGDCVAVTRDAGGAWALPIAPARGEYANETTFLTSTDWASHLQVEFLASTPDRIALFSDGLLRLALNLAAGVPHAPFFDSLFAFLTAQPSIEATLEALSQFLESDRVNARTDDDKSLIVVWRDSKPHA